MLDQVIPGKGSRLQNHRDRWMNIVGRIMPGETPERAQVAMAPLWHALRAEELKALGTKAPRFVDDFVTRGELQVLPGSKGLSYERGSIREAAAGGDGDGASGAPGRRGGPGRPAAGSLGGSGARVRSAGCAWGTRAAR